MRSEAELKEMLGALSPAETQALRESIAAEGVREPIVLWSRWTCPDCGEVVAPRNTGDEWVCENCGHVLTEQEYEDAEVGGVLVDGYNRFGLAVELDIDFPVRFVTFADREEAKAWIARNQLGRRNIGPEKAAYCRGILYNETKKDTGRPEKVGQAAPFTGRTSQPIAEQFGVDESTVRRDGRFASAVDALEEIIPGTREKALSGEIPKKHIVEAGKAAKAGDEDGARIFLDKEAGAQAAKDAAAHVESMLERINRNLGGISILTPAQNVMAHCGYELATAVKSLIVCIPDEDKLVQITEAIKTLRGMSIDAQRIGGR